MGAAYHKEYQSVAGCQKLLEAPLVRHSVGHLQLRAHPRSPSVIQDTFAAFEAIKGIARLNLDAVSKTTRVL